MNISEQNDICLENLCKHIITFLEVMETTAEELSADTGMPLAVLQDAQKLVVTNATNTDVLVALSLCLGIPIRRLFKFP